MAVELDKKTGKYMFAGKIYKDGYKCQLKNVQF